MTDSSTEGASPNERLRYAARTDNIEALLEIFEGSDNYDINSTDALGNTALHYAASNASTEVLEYILSHEDCDVDPVNTIHGKTPLHLAVVLGDPEARLHVVESLLEAGADITIRDKNGQKALELVPGDEEIERLFRRAEAVNAIDPDDIASGKSTFGYRAGCMLILSGYRRRRARFGFGLRYRLGLTTICRNL